MRSSGCPHLPSRALPGRSLLGRSWRAKVTGPDGCVRACVDAAAPWNFILMLFKILLAPLCPAQRHLHGVADARQFSRVFGAFVKGHDDVCAETDLRGNRSFGRKEVRRSVEVRTKRYALLADLTQIAQAEYLKSA